MKTIRPGWRWSRRFNISMGVAGASSIEAPEIPVGHVFLLQFASCGFDDITSATLGSLNMEITGLDPWTRESFEILVTQGPAWAMNFYPPIPFAGDLNIDVENRTGLGDVMRMSYYGIIVPIDVAPYLMYPNVPGLSPAAVTV